MTAELIRRSRLLADEFLHFVNKCKSPFHVTMESRKIFANNNFIELSQTSNWNLKKGHKYFFTRNNSTIIAFHVGEQFEPSKTAFKIIGAHTDSPCLKISPVSKKQFKSFGQCHVMTYGGGLWHTWFDRDLVLAGKVVFWDGKKYTSKLWESKRPLLKIPNLAIHLIKQRKFEPNLQKQLCPLISSDLFKQAINESGQIFTKHPAALVNIISSQIGVNPENIIDFDLYLADNQPGSYFGPQNQFISSPRLDNLFSSFHAVKSLVENENKGPGINMVTLFDHEECGSDSPQGAGSPIVCQSVNRIFKLLSGNEHRDNFERAMQKSFLVSADMAHSVHPNYADRHQDNHQSQMNKGIMIKTNYNQRYATDLISASILKILAKQVSIPIQQIIVRNDSPCGSTIGPVLASGTGIKTIDIGCALLGMHSIRETCGVLDGVYYRDLFDNFYKNYEGIEHDLLDY